MLQASVATDRTDERDAIKAEVPDEK